MTATCIIVEDNKHERTVLKRLLTKHHPGIAVVGESTDVAKAVEQIRLHDPDLLFLDVQLGSEEGFDVLEQTQDARYRVVFVTGYDQYAIRAIRYTALAYLLKPLDAPMLAVAIDRLRRWPDQLRKWSTPQAAPSQADGHSPQREQIGALLHNRMHSDPVQKRICVTKSDGVMEMLVVGTILLVERIKGGPVFIRTQDMVNLQITNTLPDVRERLEELGFIQANGHTLVNSAHIWQFRREAEAGELLMSNKEQVHVSKDYRKAVIAMLESAEIRKKKG